MLILSSFLAASLPAASLTVEPEGRGDLLSVRVESGARVRRTFSLEEELELSETTQLQNGEPVPEDMMPAIEQGQSDERFWSVVDTVQEAEDGIASTFVRLYESIEGESRFSMSMDGGPMFDEGMEENFETLLTSRLAEEQVQFTWSDGGEYEPSLTEDSDLEEDDLADLDGALDLAFLLPGEAKEEGDEWTVEGTSLQRLLELGGDLKLESDEAESE